MEKRQPAQPALPFSRYLYRGGDAGVRGVLIRMALAISRSAGLAQHQRTGPQRVDDDLPVVVHDPALPPPPAGHPRVGRWLGERRKGPRHLHRAVDHGIDGWRNRGGKIPPASRGNPLVGSSPVPPGGPYALDVRGFPPPRRWPWGLGG